MKLEHGHFIVTGEDFPETVNRAVGVSVGHYHNNRLPNVQGDWLGKVNDTITDLRSGFGFGLTMDGGMARPNGTATLYMRPEEAEAVLGAYQDHTLTDSEQLPAGVQVEEEIVAVEALLRRMDEVVAARDAQ